MLVVDEGKSMGFSFHHEYRYSRFTLRNCVLLRGVHEVCLWALVSLCLLMSLNVSGPLSLCVSLCLLMSPHLLVLDPSRVASDVLSSTLFPLPVVQPQLPAVLRLAGRDSLVDGLVLIGHMQQLIPPLLSVQTA